MNEVLQALKLAIEEEDAAMGDHPRFEFIQRKYRAKKRWEILYQVVFCDLQTNTLVGAYMSEGATENQDSFGVEEVFEVETQEVKVIEYRKKGT